MWLFPWLTYLVIAFIVAALVTMAFMPDYQILVISTGIAAAIVVAMGVVHQIRSAKRH
ncbi:MAG: GABA permease [Pseudomonas citronellolis]|nr:MAG: GABA permease [Pseudomonas citronellolis]